MRVDLSQAANETARRPLLDVLVGASDIRTRGLVDSGATRVLFHTDVAIEAGLDLTNAAQVTLLHGPAGAALEASVITTQLAVAGLVWDCEVGFASAPSLREYGLLGLPFFRHFTITFRTVDDEFEVEPIEF